MMAKKSFWKLPAALAVSMALLLASCGGDDGPNIPVSNAGLGTSPEALTLSGYVYEFVWLNFDFDPFIPTTTITDITTLPTPLDVTGEIDVNGQFSFVLPDTVPAALLVPFAQAANMEGISMEDVPNVSISHPNAQAFSVIDFRIQHPAPPISPLYDGRLWRGDFGGNIENMYLVIENVSFVYVDMNVTLTLSQAFSQPIGNGGTITMNPFTIHYSQGWNAIHTRAVPTENGITVSVRGGDSAGLRWIKGIF